MIESPTAVIHISLFIQTEHEQLQLFVYAVERSMCKRKGLMEKENPDNCFLKDYFSRYKNLLRIILYFYLLKGPHFVTSMDTKVNFLY